MSVQLGIGRGGLMLFADESAALPADAACELLGRVWGYASFRGPQRAIIDHVTQGGDALVLMPTGGGKSLCFQIPALLRPGVGVVVSPLIALMQDQVSALRENGVRAFALHSGLEAGEARDIFRRLHLGEVDLLYVAPERLTLPAFLDTLSQLQIALFAIDEAHCVSQWGHDFRPDYRGLSILAERFPGVPRIALTATADLPTRKDIQAHLQLEGAELFISGFDRPNIRYAVDLKNEPRKQLLAFLKSQPSGEAGIVYCMTRKKVEEIAAFLADNGFPALPYHAGLAAGVREKNQARFIAEDGIVMVATVAFGMGIDKSNVRFVAHLDLPKSLEAYYQETGRAGRDGRPAVAWMIYGLADIVLIRSLIDNSDAPDAIRRLEKRKLDALLAYAEAATCRRQVLLRYFGEAAPEPCGNCDICLEGVESFDGTIAAQKALSAIARTGQRFGVEYLIEVLRGVASDKVIRWEHEKLKTFGCGTELDPAGWRSVFRQLLAQGMVGVDADGHGGLHLTDDARPVLRGEVTVLLRRDPRPGGRSKAGSAARRPAAALAGSDDALFQSLKKLRRTLAAARGVPPYVIFHDATLSAIAEQRPRTLEALRDIPGVGRSKLLAYGDAILDQIGAHDP